MKMSLICTLNYRAICSTCKSSHLVQLVIGDHAEELHRVSRLRALGQEHVVRPATAAEVELSRLRRAGVALPVGLVLERALVRDRHGRVHRSAPDLVVAGAHCELRVAKLDSQVGSHV